MKVTLQFIADKARVSKSLVSKVLNDKPVRVSDEKRNRILKLAQRYGYQPHAAGAAPNSSLAKNKRKKVIGLIQPGLDFLFLVRLTSAIEYYAKDAGYQVMIFNTHEDPQIERRCLEICSSGIVDGLIVNTCDNVANLEYFQALKKQGLPLVFVDRYLPDLELSYVSTDNRTGAYQLTERLIERGHHSILFVFHGKSIFTSVQMDRFEGYQQAMAAHGLDSVKEYIYSDRPLSYQPIYRMYEGSQKFTAIVLATTWDVGQLGELIRQLSCDSKIDVAAFDSFSLTYPLENQQSLLNGLRDLVIMEQDPMAIGKGAVEILLSEMDHPSTVPHKLLIPPHLLEKSDTMSHR